MPRGRSSSPTPRDSRHGRSLSPEHKRRRHDRSRSNSPGRRPRDDTYEHRRPHSHERRRTERSHSRGRDRSRERRRSHRDRSLSDSSGHSSLERDKHKRKRRTSSERRERKERKARKKEKRERKEKKKKASVSHWGKYGLISELDMFTKGPEFHTWLVEERKVNPETISKDQSKKQFARFIEDFNTATLPHEKYYDMAAHERRMSAMRSGEYLPPANDSYDPDADLKAIASAHKKKGKEPETYMTKEQLMDLRRVQNERVQAGKMKLLGMDVKQNMGVRMDGNVVYMEDDGGGGGGF